MDAGSVLPAGCPTTQPPLGVKTTCTDVGLTCVYSGYAYTCADCNPELVNSGISWCISQLSPGCPALVPTLGTACDSPGLACDYNSCVSGGSATVCDGGVWDVEGIACPAFSP